MSTKELREQAHKAVDAVPDDKLQRFVSIIEQVKEILEEAEFDARVKRIIEENRGLSNGSPNDLLRAGGAGPCPARGRVRWGDIPHTHLLGKR